MDPILIAAGALAILKQAMAAIDAGVAAGTISVESQTVLRRKVDALRTGDYSGPEWQIEPPPPLVIPPLVPPPDATKPDV